MSQCVWKKYWILTIILSLSASTYLELNGMSSWHPFQQVYIKSLFSARNLKEWWENMKYQLNSRHIVGTGD